MLVRKIAIQNVRSFHDRAEVDFDGALSILIGPNGGGKTNLLDTLIIMLRRYLLASMYPQHAPQPGQQDRYEFRQNDVLNNMILERHALAPKELTQQVEIEVEVAAIDVENMRRMKEGARGLTERASQRFANLQLDGAADWDLSAMRTGQRFSYQLVNTSLQTVQDVAARQFLEYLQRFEVFVRLNEEYHLAALSTPLLYLPVSRSGSTFQSSVQLSSYNEFESKRQNDAVSSRAQSSIVSLAVGRLAQRFRLLLERDSGRARKEFREDSALGELTELMRWLGYEWDLECVEPLKNHYDIRLTKQGSSFLVGAASSGERELLTYLFSIFALNVRDAVIVVDEPELHLHPKWQRLLLDVFERLAQSTGNQFVLATHSPTFISPKSIEYVSRVFARHQRSEVARLQKSELPAVRHLLSIVNTHNNERIFFADRVVLVEGLHDRVFFERIFEHLRGKQSLAANIEVVSVGGKHFFSAYQRVLAASRIEFSTIADLDYVEQVGSVEVKALFVVDEAEIRKDVLENQSSQDGAALVARVDEALASGDWTDARQVWEYIKGRRRRLRRDLGSEERSKLDAFLDAERAKDLHILRRGALEAYLPNGYRAKDLDKLIAFLNRDSFWDEIESEAKLELRGIYERIYGRMAAVTTLAAP